MSKQTKKQKIPTKTNKVDQSELIKALGGTTREEVEQMVTMLRDLLDAANKLSEAPYYIVQPYMGIVKRNAKLVAKYDLL